MIPKREKISLGYKETASLNVLYIKKALATATVCIEINANKVVYQGQFYNGCDVFMQYDMGTNGPLQQGRVYEMYLFG